MVDKLKMLREVVAKINDKVTVLEQKIQGSLSIDQNTGESYFTTLSSNFELSRDLGTLSEKDVLCEVEQLFNMIKDDDIIETFVKERRLNTREEGLSIYKLKSKIMNEKIDRIRQ